MGKLIYAPISSMDGYIEDDAGRFDWAMPSDDAHAFINDLMRPFGTHLYGRRLYEVMKAWETDPSLGQESPIMEDFASIWQAAAKVVFSRSLEQASTRRTDIQRDFDPESIRRMKQDSSRDFSIGGATLAATAFRAGLIDECHIFLAPIVIGSGKRSLPNDVRLKLELLEQRRFADGMVYLRYRTST